MATIGRAVLILLGIVLLLFGFGGCASGGFGFDWLLVIALGGALLWLGGRPRRKRCPECAEVIDARARRCKHCGHQIG